MQSQTTSQPTGSITTGSPPLNCTACTNSTSVRVSVQLVGDESRNSEDPLHAQLSIRALPHTAAVHALAFSPSGDPSAICCNRASHRTCLTYCPGHFLSWFMQFVRDELIVERHSECKYVCRGCITIWGITRSLVYVYVNVTLLEWFGLVAWLHNPGQQV